MLCNADAVGEFILESVNLISLISPPLIDKYNTDKSTTFSPVQAIPKSQK